MKTIQVTQGSTQWLDLRRQYDTASECPVMMGASKYQTRADLMRQKATGITPDVDPRQQALYDRGHATEGASRDILEEKTGEAFYPVTAVDEARKLLASVDGITMDDSTLFEHKLYSQSLAAQVQAGDLDPHYYWQLEQQLLVTGAEKVIFVCSDGTPDNWAQMEYRAVPGRADQLIAGWKQFNEDLAAYIPSPADVVVIPKAASSLPIVFDMRVEGKIVSCNVEQYKPAALAFIAEINTKLTTDQHFADAKADATFCRDSADKLELAIEQALGQMGDINTAINTVREIAAAFDAKGLALEKLVESQTKAIKESHVLRGQAALKAHIDALNTRLGKPYMPTVAADFGTTVKNKRTVESLRNSVDTELARAKIAASEIADRIHANREDLKPGLGAIPGDDWISLFPDFAQVCTKSTEDFRNLRIARVEAERQRREAARSAIRAEEQAKAEKDAREKLAAELAEAQRLADEQARQATPPAAPAPEPVRVPVASAPVSAPAANVVPISRPAAPADTGGRVKLGDIATSIAPLSITADGLAQLGFAHVATEKAAKLYRTADLPRIYAAMVAHIEAAQAKQAA